MSLFWWNEVFRQLRRKIVSIRLKLDQMHGQCELISIQHPIFIYVWQFPDFTQSGVGKAVFDHLCAGDVPIDFAVNRAKGGEYLVVFVAIFGDDPFGVAIALVNTLTESNTEWTIFRPVKSPSLDVFLILLFVFFIFDIVLKNTLWKNIF